MPTTSQYPEEVPFGVWAYTYNSKNKTVNTIHTQREIMSNAKVEYTDKEWLPNIPTYWPAGTQMLFFAYSPYSDKVKFSNERGIYWDDVDLTNDNTEYMFSYPISDCEREQCGGLIPLPFIRALSRVEFRMRLAVIDERKLHLKGLRVANAAYRGSFSTLPLPHWELMEQTMDVECCDKEMPVMDEITLVSIHDFMPQTLKTKLIVVVDIYDNRGFCLDKNVEISTEMNVKWHPGEYTVYTLNISTHKVTFTTDIQQ